MQFTNNAERILLEKTKRLADIIATQREIAAVATDLDSVLALVVDRARSLTDATLAAIAFDVGECMEYRAVSGANGIVGMRVASDGGLLGHCRRTNSVVYSPDVDCDPRANRDAAVAGIHAVVMVPVIGDGRVAAVLKITSDRANAFSEHHIQGLQLLAGIIGESIMHATRYRKQAQEIAEARVRQQSAVAQLGDLALRGEDIQTLFDSASELIRETIDVTHGIVMELLEDRPVLRVRAGGTSPSGSPAVEVPVVPGSLADYTLRQDGPLVVGDVTSEDRFTLQLPTRTSWIRSVANTAIRGRDRTHGILSASSQLPNAFNEQDATFLQAIAHVLADAIDRKTMEEELIYQGIHDALTGLPNRTLLADRLQQTILASTREQVPFALLLLDLDQFKELNDTFGHHIGDLLLQQFGRRVQSLLRDSDTLARLGGDELAIILPETNAEEASLVARRLVLALDEPFDLGGQHQVMDCSIGISLYPEHGQDGHLLLRHADVAMYLAKREHTGFATYSVEHDTTNADRLLLINDLRHAAGRDQFELHYQPKIQIDSGQPAGVEALLRWRHPDRGFVPPDRFIPLAEQTGLIAGITEWVITEAVRQHGRWRRMGMRVHIAVNLSARSLYDPILMSKVGSLIGSEAHGGPVLTLEVTESAMMHDPDGVMKTLTWLHDLGARISIDDFGTGYSSLAYLKRLPVDEVKIDKSFVIDMTSDRDSAFIVRTIIDLGHNLDLEVVAEGIEDPRALDELGRMGCDIAQGYWIQAPLPAAGITRWLRQPPCGLAGAS